MKNAGEMGSGAMIYDFRKDWFRHSKVDGRGHTDSMTIA
jgi:hypothetical protein